MAVVEISTVKNMKALIDYCDSGEPKNDGDDYAHLNGARVLYKSGHMVSADDTFHQMSMTQRAHGKSEGYVKGYHLIQSFSKDELDPTDKKAQRKAHKMGFMLSEELYPNAQFVVYTQADGDGGQLHNHIVINAVQPDGYSLRGDCRRWGYIAEKNDTMLLAHGMKPLPEENYTQSKDKRNSGERRATKGEYWMTKNENSKYVWKDDLKERINDVYSDSDVGTYEEFREALEERGVHVSEGKRGLEYGIYPMKPSRGSNPSDMKSLTARKIDEDPAKFTEQGLIDEYENRLSQAVAEIKAKDEEIAERERERERKREERKREHLRQMEVKASQETAVKPKMTYAKQALEESKQKQIEKQRKEQQRAQVTRVIEDEGPEL